MAKDTYQINQIIAQELAQGCGTVERETRIYYRYYEDARSACKRFKNTLSTASDICVGSDTHKGYYVRITEIDKG